MIAAHYEEDPESFHDEIKQLDQLREVSRSPFLCTPAAPSRHAHARLHVNKSLIRHPVHALTLLHFLAAACPASFKRLQWLQCSAALLRSATPPSGQVPPGDDRTPPHRLCLVSVGGGVTDILYILSLHCRKDVYTNTEYIQEGLQIEQASVLYNICKSVWWVWPCPQAQPKVKQYN